VVVTHDGHGTTDDGEYFFITSKVGTSIPSDRDR
jgi:hypothetical protein